MRRVVRLRQQTKGIPCSALSKAEFELASEEIGININKLAAQAQKGNENAIRVLLVLSFDAGAAEGFVMWLPQILRSVPDEKLAPELGLLPKRRTTSGSENHAEWRFRRSAQIPQEEIS